MIPASDRQVAITLIGEAVQAGARERLACLELCLTQRTLQRWRSERTPLEDQRPHAIKRAPSHKLNETEVQQIVEVINQAEFKSLPPSQIVPRLADQGIYLGSESTFYRVIHKNRV